MKKYETPQIEEIKVQVEDVIAASGGSGDGDKLSSWMDKDPVAGLLK